MNSFIFIFIAAFVVSNIFILGRTLKKFVTVFADQYIKLRVNTHSDISLLVESYSDTVRRLPCIYSLGNHLPHCTCLVIENLHKVSIGRLLLKTFEKEVWVTGVIVGQELLALRQLIQGPALPDPSETEIDSAELCLYLARQILAQLLTLGQMVASVILAEFYQMVFSYLTPKTLPTVGSSFHLQLPATIMSTVRHRRHSTSL